MLTTSQIPVTDEFFYSPHLSSYERVGILERILVAISTNDGFDVSHYIFFYLALFQVAEAATNYEFNYKKVGTISLLSRY